MDKKNVCFILRGETVEALRKYAKQSRQSMSRVADFAIEEAIKRELRKKD